MNKKKIYPVLLCLLFSAAFTFLFYDFEAFNAQMEINKIKENSILSQEVKTMFTDPVKVEKIYHKDKLIGVLQDKQELNVMLKEVYQTEYKKEFPNVSLSLSEDVYIVEEDSYFQYKDMDNEICTYLKNNDLFSVEVNKIVFSNGAVIYVKNLEDFEKAKDRFVLNFISEESFKLLSNNMVAPALTTYGERDLSLNVLEKTQYQKGYASKENILMDESSIIGFLSYGYNTELEYYTVEEYDTVEGVGSKNNDLSAQQVVTINSDKLTSVDQVLPVGMELNVTYFNSPISVLVQKERYVQEPVFPEGTIYIEDPTMREGLQVVITPEEEGYKDVLYKETYVNGVLIVDRTEMLSSTVIKQPVREVVKYGTKIIPGIGTGKFRYPVDNVGITCRWYCYSGHRALDVKNSYNRYGNVLAADRGVVVERSYSSVNGYYMWIDHNNGFRTYYGHMNKNGYFAPGVAVNKGEVIGQIGQTGKATGPHVHFVIEKNGVRQNPCNYLGC